MGPLEIGIAAVAGAIASFLLALVTFPSKSLLRDYFHALGVIFTLPFRIWSATGAERSELRRRFDDIAAENSRSNSLLNGSKWMLAIGLLLLAIGAIQKAAVAVF
jgi:hypothetical protein